MEIGERKQATSFQAGTETGSEDSTYQDSALSQIFKLIVTTSGKILSITKVEV